MTPVERTSTSSASSSRSRAASAALASASSFPRSPVAAFATPELITTAWGSASERCSRVISRQAAWTRLRVNIAAPVACGTERTTARSFRAEYLMPASTPDATNPCAAVTLMSDLHPVKPQPVGLGQAEREVRILHRLARRALAEVVLGRDDDRAAARRVGEHAELDGVRVDDPLDLGHDALRQDLDDRRVGVRRLEQRPCS